MFDMFLPFVYLAVHRSDVCDTALWVKRIGFDHAFAPIRIQEPC